MPATSIPTRFPVLNHEDALRPALRADACVTGVNGVAYLAAAEPLSDLLGIPAAELRGVGAFLTVFAIGVWLVAARRATPVAPVRAIVAANAAWAVGSVALVAVDWSSPTTAGAVWMILQALVVGLFATVQWLAQREEAA